MKKFKEIIVTILSMLLLLVQQNFIAMNSSEKNLSNIDAYVAEFGDGDDKSENEYCGLDILDWINENQKKSLAGAGVALMLYKICQGTYEIIRDPTEDELCRVHPKKLIKENLPYVYKNQENLTDLPDQIKMNVIIEICKNLSEKHMRELDAWWTTNSVACYAVKLSYSVVRDYLYSLQKNSDIGLSLLARLGPDGETECYHIASAIKKCADFLGIKCMLVLNYAGHVFPIFKLTTSKLEYSKFGKSHDWESEIGSWMKCESLIKGVDNEPELSWAVGKVCGGGWCDLYESDVIFNDGNAYIIVNDQNKTTSEAISIDKPSKVEETDVIEMLDTIYSNENIEEYKKIKKVPEDAKPIKACYPVSYLNMIRKL